MPPTRVTARPDRIRAACLIALALGAGAADAAIINISEVDFDPAWATTTATITGGGYTTDLVPTTTALHSGTSPDWTVAPSLGTYFQVPRFQPGYDPVTPVNGPTGTAVTLGQDARFPETSQNPRDIIQLTWDTGYGLANVDGVDDLAIFEAATSEAFTIRVHNATAGSVGWSAWYYKPYRQSDPRPQDAIDNDTTPTLFDLGALGIGDGDVINAIEISNLLITDKVHLLVDSLDDYTLVDFDGTAGYTNDPLRYSTSQGIFVAFEAGKFDPDIQYVVGLHELQTNVSGTISALSSGLGLSFPQRLDPTGPLPVPGAPLLLAPGLLWLLAQRRARLAR